jgi:uncharacterized membrane protein
MYISTECYYDIYLKDKESDAVMAEILKLREEIGRLKYKLESPTYLTESAGYYMEDAQISACRGYLSAAYDRYYEITDERAVTERELAAEDFSARLIDVRALTLTLGTCYQYKYQISFCDGKAYRISHHVGANECCLEVPFSETLDEIRELNIGEWDEYYSLDKYGFAPNEPVRWKLRVDFSLSQPSYIFEGVGVFPYNFKGLLDIMGADLY